MRTLFAIAMSILLSMTVSAQQEVTQFLGIPVDGSKAEMIEKLKAKGFRSSSYNNEILEGEFNGTNVHIHVVTNNNRVYRIMVADANRLDERAIQIRFNKLCRQFSNNPKYISFSGDQTIPDDEDISYEMNVHKKRYEAAFYQKPTDIDSTEIANRARNSLLKKYTEEQISEFTEEDIQLQMTFIKWNIKRDLLEKCSKRSVWFLISESELRGKYYICMYYDNEYNMANGEDL